MGRPLRIEYPDAFYHITAKEKNLVKSGGEWISTLTLENLINMHPKAQEVVVFAAKS